LPAQYLETVSRKTHLEPEKKLMLAVLEDAVACFQKYGSVRDGKGRILSSEAEEWILLEHSGDWLFSFDNICEALGLNPKYIREGLLRWRQRSVGERPKAKIYRLSPRSRGKKRTAMPGGTERRFKKAAGR
ncbi:MAG: hypothetical protein ACE5I0_08020, partial [Candidatus Binatia bacterium]